MKKRIIKILTAIGLTMILFIFVPYVFNFLYFGGIYMPSPNKEQMERNFERNKSLLTTIVNYMENVEYDTIIVNDFNANIPIENWKTSTAIHILLWRKYYNSISKHNGTVIFQKWKGIQDINQGIAYSIDGKEPMVEFLTLLEPLSEPGWYYYKADYEEWRIRTNDIFGVWSIQFAENRNTKENYPLQDLYGIGLEQSGTLIFNADFTFSRYIGITTDKADYYEGTYRFSYDDKIILRYNNGATNTVRYLPSSREMVYYTWDKDQIPIDEYYIKLP